ncbi:MAG: hydroxymethylglutaryl-CoA lyase [Acidothermus sp.]|nr:hydroxymethylglutaryl-CoA lyase [Acidothermus sp.]
MDSAVSPPSSLPRAVSICEVGPRDGLQDEAPVPTEGKIALVDALSATGISRIEVASFVHPKAVPAMADAEAVWAGIARNPQVRYSALVPNTRGAQRALDVGITEVNVVVSASETHNKANVRRTVAESLDDIAEIIERVHEARGRCRVTISTAWGCPYEGEVPESRVVDIARRVIADGADGVSLGDTTGMATPTRVWSLVRTLREQVGDISINVHFHDTRGTGLANVLAALQIGVTDFDASVGGLGGCPYAPGAAGNIATEELVAMLDDMGVATGVDLDALLRAATLAEELVGHRLPSRLLRIGPRTRRVPAP